jgi:hypothetical protein
VVLYDANKQLIWRGSAPNMVSDNATKNENNPNKGVAKMLKDFSPSSAKTQAQGFQTESREECCFTISQKKDYQTQKTRRYQLLWSLRVPPAR